MTKVALYARYSTDMQSENSIEDQFRTCRERASREGWTVVTEYEDRALSGASMMRPGIQSMLEDARAGKFDIVLGEALDRFSRDQEDIAHIYKHLHFEGIDFITLSEGVVNEMHIGLNGTMNSLFLKELARKTHRGLEGRVLEGKSAGGRAYGHKTIRKFREDGTVASEERVIVAEEAKIILRIFEDYIKGKSPKKIAFELNEEGITSPSGKGWGASTINGNRQRGTGILNNELYIGRQVWNKVNYKKDPRTGKKRARINPKEDWVITEVPELRIVPQELWDKVKEFQGALDKKPAFNHKKRPPRLLSYLLKCGECGGGMAMVSQTQYGCSTARNKGTCTNRKTINQKMLEAKVIGTLQSRLMNADLTKVFCEEYTAHLNKVRMDHNSKRLEFEAELVKVERAIKKIVESIADGIDVSLIKDKANGLQRRKEELISILDTTEEAPAYIHPAMGHRYTQAVNELIGSFNDQNHRDESAQILRKLIDKIVLTPNENKSALVVDLYGDLAGILQISQKHARGKIELKPKDALDKTEASELEQVKELLTAQQTSASYAIDMDEQVQMVEGVKGALNLRHEYGKVQVVAGVGFEPTTFRL